MKNNKLTNRSGNYIIILLLISVFSSCIEESSNKELIEDEKEQGYYINPVINKNFPDPTLIKAADGYYYVYATNSEVNGKLMHIQVRRSKDMIHWENLGDALPEKPSWASKDFWAPHVIYDENTEKYYLYYSGESNNKDLGKCLGVAVSDSPEGPFVDKGEPLLCGEGFVNIDPMAFDDPTTGKKLLYWGSGFGAIKVQELAADRMSFKEGSAPVELIQPIANNNPNNYQKLVEGAWVVYRDGYYYLYYSGDNCCGEEAHYAAMVARSKKAIGPFETFAESTGGESSVILKRNERWIAPGHNSIVTDEAGQDWAVYHAIDSKNRSKGRVMLIDRIIYGENAWPKIETGTPSLNEEKAPVVN